MFGKKKCDTGPVFRDFVRAGSAAQERAALAALKCSSGAELKPVGMAPPSAAALVKAAALPDAVWMYAHQMECSRCKKVGDVTVALPDGTDTPAVGLLRAPVDATDESVQKAVKAAAQAMARHLAPLPRPRAA